MPACVSLDAFPDKRCGARVRRIAPYVLDREKQARTVEVELEFTEPGQADALLPGYSADIEIILEQQRDVLRLPTEAVLEGDKVLRIDPDDRLQELIIQTGLSNWQWTQVTGGLKESDRVITSVDRDGVNDGALVSVEAGSEGD